jgi:TRAP-type C4-dicarboxylate transport system substrate-binding protein
METMMKRLAAAVVIALTFALPAVAQTKWDVPTAYPANNFHTENLQQFASDVEKATGGKLKIQVHPNASLFKAPEIKRAVQGGQAQAGEILLVNFENEDPLYGVDGVPFLATSYADAMKLYKASRKALEDKFAKQGIKLLYTVPWPPQGIFTKRTLASANDMKGLKWRAYSPATAKIAELVGAQPMTVQAAEVSQALATGVIDSYMSSGATGYDIWTLSLDHDHAAHPFVQSPAFERLAQFSPDGRWIAYTSDESRGNQVYVVGYPAHERRWQVSTEGGGTWS